MADCLTGPAGFYRQPGAAPGHFRTASSSGQFAAAMAVLLDRVDWALGRSARLDLWDLGAADGRLLANILAALPAGLRRRVRAVAVDLGRPERLPARVGWAADLADGITGLVLANEWLDTVPVELVQWHRGRLHVVEVDEAGRERLGPPADPPDRDWALRYWPSMDQTGRVEVGRWRDLAWARVTSRLNRGVAVAVDYPLRSREAAGGTLAGYARGRQVQPRLDGSVDVTASVHFAAAAAAGGRADGQTRLLSQRTALRRLWTDTGNQEPLSRLKLAGERRELTQRGGFGDFWWLVQTVRLPAAVVLERGRLG